MGGLSQQVDFTMGGLSQRMDIARGGSPQRGKSRRRAYSRRQRGQQRLGPLIGRSGPWALQDRVGRQPVCRGVCCGLNGAAPLGLEPTGGGGRGSGSPEESGVPVPTAAAKLAAKGLFNEEILYGHWGFGLTLRLIGLSGLLFREVRGGNFALALRSVSFVFAL